MMDWTRQGRTGFMQLRLWGRDGWRWLRNRPVRAILIYLLLVSVFFLTFPGVDLWASGLFFSQDAGFWARWHPFLRDFRHLGPHLVTWIAVVCAVVLVIKLVLPGRRPLMPLRTPLFLLTSLILGPGVLVNLVLKNNWGRPRPVMIEQFGGDMPYEPVWKVTQWCDTNCSFVSGEASAGMWLVAAVVLVAPVGWRAALLGFFVPLGLLLSLNRIAFGGHFLSDTLMSWGLTLLVIVLLHRLFFIKAPRVLRDHKLDQQLTRLGRRLQGRLKQFAAQIGRSAQRFVTMFRDR